MLQPRYYSHRQTGTLPAWITWLLLSFFPATGLLLLGVSFYLLSLNAVNGLTLPDVLLDFLPYASLALFLCYLGWTMIAMALAQYKFEQDGLWVKYPFCKPHQIQWSEFQQICVCYGDAIPRGACSNTVICCVKKGEKKNIYDRWKTNSPLRYRSVVCIDYSPDLHEGLKQRCPLPIVDLRQTPAYRTSAPKQ